MLSDTPQSDTVTTPGRSVALTHRTLLAQQYRFWAYPALLLAAEALVALGLPAPGLAAHGLLLLALAYHSAFGAVAGGRRLAMALMLVPLMRVVGLALPGGLLPPLALYVASGAATLVATWLVVSALRLPRAAVGLTVGQLWMQLMVTGCGVALGYAGYVLVEPAALVAGAPWQMVALAALALLLFTGFAEELVFRGLLQSVAGPVLGRWGPLYLALVYAAIQAGFGSPLYMLLAFIVGLVFAGVARLSGSIVGVALAHGVASAVSLLAMPYVAANPGTPAAEALNLAMAIGGVCALIAVVLMAMAQISLTALPGAAPEAPAGGEVARLRRAAQLSYTELGQRAGLPARQIAEFELGLLALGPEQTARLAAALGVGVRDLLPG
jgi:membrane protease YdiL (CAAX protease family)